LVANCAAVALLALFAVLPTESSAQATSAADRLWLSGGLGAGKFVGGGSGIIGGAGVTQQRGPHLFAIRAMALLEVAGGDIGDSVVDIGLLYGRASTGQGIVGHRSAAAGLSLLDVSLRGPRRRRTLGVSLAAEATANGSVIGLGLRGFANLNTVRAYAGLVLILKLGRLN